MQSTSQKEKSLLCNYAKLDDLFEILAKHWILLNCLIQPNHNLIVIMLWHLKSFFLKSLLNCLLMNASSKLVSEEANDLHLLRNYFYIFCVITQSSYFTQGNSNSLNTVQISSGMVGINYMNEALIALLLLSATYASHVYWFLELMQHLARFSFERRLVQSTISTDTSLVKCLFFIFSLTFLPENDEHDFFF